MIKARQRQYQNRDLIHELKRTKEELLKFKISLENQNKELETIIGIVSHDLRAPLVNISGFSNEIGMDIEKIHTAVSGMDIETKAEINLQKILQDRLPESLSIIQTSADAMNSLIVTLVEVARVGFAPIRPEKLDMNALMKNILASIKIKFKQASVSYFIDDLPDCFADKTQVEQIFRNLLDNAIKYLDPDRAGQICIGGKLEAGTALYCIADNGIGISPENQEIIFEPYYQLQEKAAGGMGMGLATVKRMVDRNGGRIWVVSEKGKYSIFYVALPSF